MTSAIMDLFREWQALDERNESEVLSDNESDARAHHMVDLGQRMRDIGPKTVSELAAFFYARTIGGEVPCGQEDAKLLLDLIEVQPKSAHVTFNFDLEGASFEGLRAVFDVARVINDLSSAVGCQPRCSSPTGLMGSAVLSQGGDMVEAFELAAAALCERLRKEALRRPPSTDPWERAAQFALAMYVPEDPEEAIEIAQRFVAQGKGRA